MRISDSCAKCMYDRQQNKTNNKEYLAEIKALLDNRGENETAPHMVYLFNQVHMRYFGKGADYKDIKKKYNDLVLGMENTLRKEIEEDKNPLAKAIIMARIGNYIDFGAMNNVDPDEFLALFDDTKMKESEQEVYKSFVSECEKGKKFLLLCDNCGEIVLDKLLIEQIKKRFPHLEITVMVRGSDILNDATIEDAKYCGIDKVARVVSNGEAVAGTIYDMLSEEAKKAFDEADIIFSKGLGNYEALYGFGWHVFFAFLCKCQHFMDKFNVPMLTGMFIEENA